MSRIRTLVSTATTPLLNFSLQGLLHLPQGFWFAAIGKASDYIFEVGWWKGPQWTQQQTLGPFFDYEFGPRLPIARFAQPLW